MDRLDHRGSKLTRSMVTLAIGSLLSGCSVAFEHAPTGSYVDPEPYLGDWVITTGETLSLRVLMDEEDLVAGLSIEGRVITETVEIVDIGGDTFASVKSERESSSGVYNLLSVDVVGNSISIRLINETKIIEDVESGALVGTSYNMDIGSGVRVSAAGSDLADYFSTPGAFDVDGLTFVRATPTTGPTVAHLERGGHDMASEDIASEDTASEDPVSAARSTSLLPVGVVLLLLLAAIVVSTEAIRRRR